MRHLLVVDGLRPEDVVLHRVAVEKFDGGSLLNRQNVRGVDEALLVDNRLRRGRRESPAGNSIDIDNRFALADFAFNRSSKSSRCKNKDEQEYEQNTRCHKSPSRFSKPNSIPRGLA